MPEPVMDDPGDRKVRRARRGGLLGRIWRFYARFVRLVVTVVVGAFLIAAGVLFINYVVLSTPKDRAYRDIDPTTAVCQEGLDRGWTVLADTGRDRLRTLHQADDGGWVDPSSDELAVTQKDPSWTERFRCALQRHIIPATEPGHKNIEYDLGFIEFQENGEPYALVGGESYGSDDKLNSAMLEHSMENEMHEKHMAASQVKPVISQLDVMKKHLSTGSNYVLVFVHGWRHNAAIGDENVADARLYGANAARFIAQRCQTDPRFCDMKVTVIYIGWRGARVDERGLRHYFGDTIGGFLGNLSAAVTLFDRKPVAEAIAPAAISAIRSIETTLSRSPEGSAKNKMIVFGHSLGGDMLATGLEDDLVKAVRRHKFGDNMPPVLGNLVVLINPAAEASKWIAVQKEVWDRLAFKTNEITTADDVIKDNGFFPVTQRPVIVSVTAALAFPAGGLRPGDCAWIGLRFDDQFKGARENIRAALAKTEKMFDTGIEYDWATHDLFPTFKFDFRPAAAYLDRVASRIEHHVPKGEGCTAPGPVNIFAYAEALPVRALSILAATFPFQVTAPQESHTIGNLDPPRPAGGVLADALPSAAPFGTTHELLGLQDFGVEKHHPYATLADADIDCPATNLWLTRARAARKDQYGLFWDSQNLAPPTPGIVGQGEPSAQFLQGLYLSGMAPITRADDPFWNVRAFDNALSRHDGYKLTSFICAMNALVLDDITGSPATMSNQTVDPDHPEMKAAH